MGLQFTPKCGAYPNEIVDFDSLSVSPYNSTKACSTSLPANEIAPPVPTEIKNFLQGEQPKFSRSHPALVRHDQSKNIRIQDLTKE